MYDLRFVAFYVLAVVLGAVTIVTLRKFIAARIPTYGAYLAVVAAAGVIFLTLESLGMSFVYTSQILAISAFFGTQLSSTDPWSPESISTSLAVASGLVALTALIGQNLIATAIALVATALLLWLPRLRFSSSSNNL